MRRVHSACAALVLTVTTSAWAGGGPYPVDKNNGLESSKTRAQVIAELQEAHRLGLMPGGEAEYPNFSAGIETADMTVVVSSDRSGLRARILAEAVEAARLGLLGSGEGDPTVATAEQEALIAAAGQHAVDAIRSAQGAVRTSRR